MHNRQRVVPGRGEFFGMLVGELMHRPQHARAVGPGRVNSAVIRELVGDLRGVLPWKPLTAPHAIDESRSPAEPPAIQPQILVVKDLQLNRASRQVSRDGQVINLTPTEFDILATLMAHPDQAIDSITLIKEVRGYDATEADARAIARVHVHRLRHKLETNPSRPEYVTTVAGGRYLMSSQ